MGLAFLLLLEQLVERSFVLVLKPARVEVPRFRFHDMRGEVEHILGNFLVGNVAEILFLLSYLVRISERYAEQPLAACFKRNDVLTRREHNLAIATMPSLRMASRMTANAC